MVQHVSDIRANNNEIIANAAKAIGRSEARIAVFEKVYYGKKAIKTVLEIAEATGYERKRITEVGKDLVNSKIFEQTKKDGVTAYKKYPIYTTLKRAILRLVKDPKKLAQYPTKSTPRPIGYKIERTTFSVPKGVNRSKQITVDDIDSFSKVRTCDLGGGKYAPMLEDLFKKGIKTLLKERGEFKDWGGERNDLLTTRLMFKGRRRATAFAFKGKGTKGILKPSMMGRNGDQIQRLLMSTADIFLVQYWGQIDESVLEQMRTFAFAKSVSENREIVFGIIDGQDTSRIIKAYPRAFE